MSTWLIFQCAQVLMMRLQWTQKISRTRYVFRWIYWTLIVLTTFIAGVGWAISRKPDAAAIQFLASVVGLIGVSLLLYQDCSQFESKTLSQTRWYLTTMRGFNRLFRIIHTACSILFAAGAITLALQFQYKNPCITRFPLSWSMLTMLQWANLQRSSRRRSVCIFQRLLHRPSKHIHSNSMVRIHPRSWSYRFLGSTDLSFY